MNIPSLRRLQFLWRQEGGVRFVRRVLGKAKALSWSRQEWLLYRRPGEIPSEDLLPPGFKEMELSMAELRSFGFFKALEVPDLLEARFANRERCFGFIEDGQLAHVAWLTTGYLTLDTGLPPIPCREGHGIYDCFTLPAFRRRGVFKGVLTTLLREARAEGGREVLIAVDEGNLPSRKAIESTGFALEEKVVAFHRLGTTRLRRSPRSAEPASG